jgi:hypothetical protein
MLIRMGLKHQTPRRDILFFLLPLQIAISNRKSQADRLRNSKDLSRDFEPPGKKVIYQGLTEQAMCAT